MFTVYVLVPEKEEPVRPWWHYVCASKRESLEQIKLHAEEAYGPCRVVEIHTKDRRVTCLPSSN